MYSMELKALAVLLYHFHDNTFIYFLVFSLKLKMLL